jgi:formate dehydrogenase major subunit
VNCGVIIHTLGDRSRNVKPSVVHVEGDPDHPINQGTLCPKGITLKQNIVNDRRLTKVLYRAPGSRTSQPRSASRRRWCRRSFVTFTRSK